MFLLNLVLFLFLIKKYFVSIKFLVKKNVYLFYRDNLAKTAFFTLQVVSIILKISFKDFNSLHKIELKQLIELQAILINAIALSKNKQ